MSYVIAVCGAGGKTTLVKNFAKKFASENKKVCITTTTHMWFDEDVKKHFVLGSNAELLAEKFSEQIAIGRLGDKDIEKKLLEPGKICYASNLDPEKELIIPLNETDYRFICDEFDYVIVEADGSRSMPMKIPRGKFCEPVIPDNVNEIVIVEGTESIGREVGAVCHRFNEFYGKDKFLDENKIKPDTIVTEKLLDNFVKHYYYEPLSKEFGDATIKIYKNNFDNSFDNSFIKKEANEIRIGIVLLAAGFSKRFGSNKLLINMTNNSSGTQRKLYQLMIEKLLKAKEMILEKERGFKVDIAVISQYEEILNDKNYIDKVTMIKNENADRGQSETIKLGTNYFKEYDAIVFVNADMPYLPENEIANFVILSCLNNSSISSMYSNEYKNPAYFEKKHFDEILKINGDRGPRELFYRHKMKVYRYYIRDKYLTDIDCASDLI